MEFKNPVDGAEMVAALNELERFQVWLREQPYYMTTRPDSQLCGAALVPGPVIEQYIQERVDELYSLISGLSFLRPRLQPIPRSTDIPDALRKVVPPRRASETPYISDEELATISEALGGSKNYALNQKLAVEAERRSQLSVTSPPPIS